MSDSIAGKLSAIASQARKEASEVCRARLLAVMEPRSWFHVKQTEAWEAKERVILMQGGFQSGKTSLAPWWLAREIGLTALTGGDNAYLVVCVNYPLAEKQLLPMYRAVFVDSLRMADWRGAPERAFVIGSDAAETVYGRRFTARVHLVSGTDSGSLESITARGAHADEIGQDDFAESSYDALLRRLFLHSGRLLITTYPYSFNWFKRRVHDKAGDGEVRLVETPTACNPLANLAEIERARVELPRYKYETQYLGRYSRPVGAIYDPIGPHTLITRRALEDRAKELGRDLHSWVAVVGLDFGDRNTFAVKILVEPPTDERETTPSCYVVGSYDGTQAREMSSRVAAILAMRPNVVVGGSPGESDWRAKYSQAGLYVRQPPARNVEVGIDTVYRYLVAGRLRFLDECKAVYDQMTAYSRECDNEGNALSGTIWEKNKYHYADCIRYAMLAIDNVRHQTDRVFFGDPSQYGEWDDYV